MKRRKGQKLEQKEEMDEPSLHLEMKILPSPRQKRKVTSGERSGVPSAGRKRKVTGGERSVAPSAGRKRKVTRGERSVAPSAGRKRKVTRGESSAVPSAGSVGQDTSYLRTHGTSKRCNCN